jgi:hypothetical protein
MALGLGGQRVLVPFILSMIVSHTYYTVYVVGKKALRASLTHGKQGSLRSNMYSPMSIGQVAYF